jgi:type IV secretion system protein VirB4
LFDTSAEIVGQDRMMYFEMEELMNSSKQLIQATIMYIFHKLEQLFTGEPTLLVLDESWVFLSSEIFAGKLREWLKVLRKKNASVVFATQSLADVTESNIAGAVADSVATRIFLPNPKALDPNIAEIYRKFGLNQQEIMNLSRAQQKRDYYVSSVVGTRMFQLDLSRAALAFTAGASPETNALCDRIFQSVGGDPDAFIEAWCGAKGVEFDIQKPEPALPIL